MASRAPAARTLLAALALLSVAAGPGSAAAPAAPSTGAPRPTTRIDLPMAADAESRLETVERLLADRQWQRALPLLQAMIDEDAGLVWDGRAYMPSRDFATRRVAALPAEARGAYEALYGPAARRLLEEGLEQRSEATLREAAGRYLNTDCGPRAVSALAALRMDRGKFAGALRTLRSAGAVEPQSPAGRAIAVRTLVCLARLGRHDEAVDLAGRMRDSGIATVEIAGTEHALDDFLSDALAQAPPKADAQGGARAPTTEPSFKGKSLSAIWTDLPWPGAVEPDWPSIPSTQPVACGGSLYVNRDGTVLAADAETAQLRWGAAPRGGARELAYAIASHAPLDQDVLPLYLPVMDVHHWQTFDNHGLSSLCCADGRLYAVQMDPLWQKSSSEPWTATQDDIRFVNELRCFDAGDGTPLWSTMQVDGGALRDRWFATAPAVEAGRAHVLSLRSGEVRAVCLDAATGRPLWDTPVGPVAGRQEGQRYSAELFLADCGLPAVADGVAVYPTGRGAAAAFDALDGRLLWIAAYPRADMSINRLGLQLNVPNGPWTPGPPLFSGGLCIIAPSDSRHVVALSLETGTEAWRAEFPGGVALLGARDGRLYVQHRGVTCMDAASGAVLWEAPFDAPTTGLGALSESFAYVPQQEGLRVVHLGAAFAWPSLPWPAGVNGNGNLLVHAGTLAMCSPERIAVLRPADAAGSAADSATAPDPAEAAIARLRRACREDTRAEALTAYLALCRETGELPHADGWSLASTWTRLAEVVGEDVPRHSPWIGEWHAACAEATERAAAAGDEQALEELVRRAPFAQDRAAALLRLGEWLERTARPAEARRAYAEVIVRRADVALTQAARAGLERLLGPAGTDYAALLTGGAPAAALELTPTPGPAWEMPGIPALPERGTGARIPGKVLVLQQTGLVCVDAVTGEPAWKVPLVRGGAPDEIAPNPSALPNRQIGRGFPAFLAGPGRIAVALPALTLGVAVADGGTLWTHDVALPRAPASSRPLQRLQLIRWALRGLPVPPASSFTEPEPEQPGTWGPLLACRIEEPGTASAVDPFDGAELFRYGGEGRPDWGRGGPPLPGGVRGALLAVAGGRLCIAEGEPPVVSVLDGRTGALLTRWQLPPSLGKRSLLPTPGGNVVLADTARAFRFDLGRMQLAECLPVHEGIDEVLLADDEWVVLRTLAGGAAALPVGIAAALNVGRDGAAKSLADGPGRPAWAARSGDTVWLLDAAEVLRTLFYGPDRHFVGSGFCLRAVRLTDGTPLWRADLEPAAPAVVSEPVRCGRLWLLTVVEKNRTRVLGLDAAAGGRAFDVELPGDPALRPVPVLVEGGRVVLGLGDRVVALQPGEALPDRTSPPRAGP